MKQKLFLLLLLVFLVSCSRTQRIRIKDRWWTAATYVRWTETDTRYVCHPESDYVCSGFGDDRECHTEVTTECGFETTSTTYTRCSTHAEGRELPVEYPAAGCALGGRDRIENRAGYFVSFDTEKETKIVAFDPILWRDLPPGFDRNVVIVFNKITKLAKE